MKKIDTTLALIAEQYLDINTLEPRNSDRLDFHEVGVISLKRALEAAFEAGKKSCHKYQITTNH